MKNVLKKYQKLEQQAEIYYGKFDSKCSEMLELIRGIVSDEVEIDELEFSVIKQTGDGYVLISNMAENIPVDKMIQQYERTGHKLNYVDFENLQL